MNITSDLEFFVETKLSALADLGIDVSTLELDHFGYQTSSKEDYDNLKIPSNEIGDLISENIVNGRRVGIYRLKIPIRFQNYTILGFELVEPKEGQICSSHLDHIEMVLNESFESFIQKYPKTNWNFDAMNRPEFPKVSYFFDDGTSVKFHPLNIFEEIPKE